MLKQSLPPNKITLLVLVVLFSFTISHGQMTNFTSPEQSFNLETAYNSNGKESINLSNGQINITEPLISIPGRNGLNLDIQLLYSGSGWYEEAGYGSSVKYFSTVGLGWNLNIAGEVRLTHFLNSEAGYINFDAFKSEVILPDGSSHKIIKGKYDYETAVTDTFHYILEDLPDWKVLCSNFKFTVLAPNGIKYFYERYMEEYSDKDDYRVYDVDYYYYRYQTIVAFLTKIQDENGNNILFNYVDVPDANGYLGSFWPNPVTLPSGSSTITYAAARRLSEIKHNNGNSVQFTYGIHTTAYPIYFIDQNIYLETPLLDKITYKANASINNEIRFEYNTIELTATYDPFNRLVAYPEVGHAQTFLLKRVKYTDASGNQLKPDLYYAYDRASGNLDTTITLNMRNYYVYDYNNFGDGVEMLSVRRVIKKTQIINTGNLASSDPETLSVWNYRYSILCGWLNRQKNTVTLFHLSSGFNGYCQP